MEETPCICVTLFQLKHEALLVLGPCECSSYLCCWCAIFELFANLTSRFILVSLVGTRLAHLRHMELVPTLPLSFTLTAAPPTCSVLLCLITLMAYTCMHLKVQKIFFLELTYAWIGE
jgi:hypothetical protein